MQAALFGTALEDETLLFQHQGQRAETRSRPNNRYFGKDRFDARSPRNTAKSRSSR